MSEATAKGGEEEGAFAAKGTPLTKGKATTLESLYRLYWAELCKYINHKFGPGPPDPEDIAQAVFAKYATLEAPDRVVNPRSYLYRMAKNEMLAHHRREGVKSKHAEGVERLYAANSTDDLSAERILLAKERMRVIEETIAAMPERKRTVVLLSRFEGLSKAEIARRLGISQTQVKRLLAQAMVECHAAVSTMERGDR